MVDLAKRAVACKGWRWMPGMRWIGLVPANTGRILVFRSPSGPVGAYLPDLTDHATVGCLLALVREAKGAPLLQLTNSGIGWTPWIPDPLWAGTMCDTEAEALVAALESADG